MQDATCHSCGAPLDLRPEDLRAGVVKCPYCSASVQLAEKIVVEAPSPNDLDDGVKIGCDRELIPRADLQKTATRPAETKIVLDQEPGVRFFAGLVEPSVGCGFIALGIAAVVGAVIASGLYTDFVRHQGRNWPAGIVPGLVVLFGLWIALSQFRQRVTVEARDGRFVTSRRQAFGTERLVHDWNQVTDIRFAPIDGGDKQLPIWGIVLHTATEAIQLWPYCSNLTAAEQLWFASELRRFFAPIWQRNRPAVE